MTQTVVQLYNTALRRLRMRVDWNITYIYDTDYQALCLS
jgi:hypothetical protein